MRYQLQVDHYEPIYHARTAAQLMMQELNVDDQVTRKSTAAINAAYQALPNTGDCSELKNLMASLAHSEPAVINQSKEVRDKVLSRLISIMEEVRIILE